MIAADPQCPEPCRRTAGAAPPLARVAHASRRVLLGTDAGTFVRKQVLRRRARTLVRAWETKAIFGSGSATRIRTVGASGEGETAPERSGGRGTCVGPYAAASVDLCRPGR